MIVKLYFTKNDDPEEFIISDEGFAKDTNLPTIDPENLYFYLPELFERSNLKNIITGKFHPVDTSDGYPTLIDEVYSVRYEKQSNGTIKAQLFIHLPAEDVSELGHTLVETVKYLKTADGFIIVKTDREIDWCSFHLEV